MMNHEELSALRFSCTQCGACCGGAPGYVFLTSEDIQKLCRTLEMPEEELIQTFARKIVLNGRKIISLKEKPNYDCIFLENKRCQVYDARPLQCRAYPFWPRIVESVSSWEKEKKHCPGIGSGELINVETALSFLSEIQKDS